MTSYAYSDLWEHVKANSKVLAQDYHELQHVFNLMLGSESYLEIGSSEGNSLYVLGHALKAGGAITYVDAVEKHTAPWREPKEQQLLKDGYSVRQIKGNTHHTDSIAMASERHYDCVLIDAGHTYDDVKQDAEHYAPLADKYVFFHDVQMPEVDKAFMQYAERTKAFWYKLTYDKRYGFGVIKK